MVAEAVGREAHQVHELDRRRVPEERGDRRRRADGVACGHREVVVPGLRAIDVEPRLQERRAADRERRVDRSAAGQVVGGLGQRDELAVVVGDVEDRDLLVLPRRLREVVEDLAARILRAGDVHQERDRRRDVDRADVRDRVLLLNRQAPRR